MAGTEPVARNANVIPVVPDGHLSAYRANQ